MSRSRTECCRAGLFARTLVWIVSGFATAAHAAEPLTIDPLGGWQIAKVTAGLLVVVAAIVATAAGLKRLKGLHAAHGTHLKIIDGISVSTRDRIILLEVDQQRLLVGISPGRIQPLHVLDGNRDAPAFADHLAQADVTSAPVAEVGQ